MARALRILLALTLTLALAVALGGCGDSSEDAPAETESESSATEEVTSDQPMTDEELATALEEQYGSESWYANVQWIGTDQILLAEVTRVETDLDSGAYETAAAISDAVWSLLSADAINVQIVSADGAQMSGSGSGSPLADTMDVPPPPTNAEELQAWLDEVYGDSGEDWYGHIESIELSDDIAGWSGTTLIVVNTDLEGQSGETLTIGQTMGQAISSTGQTIADNFVVIQANGEQLLSGGMAPAPWVY